MAIAVIVVVRLGPRITLSAMTIGLGPIAIVIPLTSYPVVAILVRRFWMDERLSLPQKFAVGLALLGVFLTSL